jgi:hypothetical protein
VPDTPLLQRATSGNNGPWWFGSAGDQRIDLPEPHGTCYLAVGVITTIREKARERMLHAGTVPAGLLAGWSIFDLKLPPAVTVADTVDERAVEFGANRELATVPDYSISYSWASAFHAFGFGAIAYPSRFTSGAKWNALALFGSAGEQKTWPYERKRPAAEALRAAGLDRLISGRSGLTFVAPPGTGRP